jgi:hypothetical protein
VWEGDAVSPFAATAEATPPSCGGEALAYGGDGAGDPRGEDLKQPAPPEFPGEYWRKLDRERAYQAVRVAGQSIVAAAQSIRTSILRG